VRKLLFVTGLLILGVSAFPGSAAAVEVKCPDPVLGNTAGTDNQYMVDPALDCVYDKTATGNIGQGSGDQFLAGDGEEEDSYGDGNTVGSTFGKTWTMVCTSGSATGTCSGLTITLGDNVGTPSDPEYRSATWAVTDTSYLHYALGVKDGTGPAWAVFLLDSNALSGTVSMIGGSFSHFVLYGSDTPTPNSTSQNLDPAPEPGSLILLGSGLLATVRHLRKRKQGNAVA